MRGARVLSAAFAAFLSSGCFFFADENRNDRLAIWDSETGEWKIVSGEDAFGREGAWLPDSSGIVVLEGNSAVLRSPTRTKLWEVGGGGGDLDGAVAVAPNPNGEFVAVLRRSWLSDRDITTLDLVDASDGSVRETVFEHENIRLSGANREGYDLAWSGDGQTVAVIAPRAPGLDLFWLDADANWKVTTTPTVENEAFIQAAPVGDGFVLGLPGQLLYTTGPGDERALYDEPAQGASDPAFSPDGKRVVFGTQDGLVVVELETGSLHQIDGSGNGGVTWGADRIAFVVPGGIATAKPDGSDKRTIVEFRDGRYARALSWSPDARYLAFIVVPEYQD